MFTTRKLPHTIFYPNYNLKHFNADANVIRNYHFSNSFNFLYGVTRNEAFKRFLRIKNKLSNLFNSETFCKHFDFTRSLKEQSSNLLRVWAHQCECVMAQRIRRGQQMFALYSKLWEERALREILRKIQANFFRRGREFLLGTVAVSAYDWDKFRISENEMRKSFREFDYVNTLKLHTICQDCKLNGHEGNDDEGVKPSTICPCLGHVINAYAATSYDSWETFVEKKDLVVWRRPHDKEGHFEYKVYGSYDDVTAEEFLNVQVDVNYRKTWDTTAIQLEVVEKDPVENSNGDVLYWEMLWPRLFANRDYVFIRRYLVDSKNKVLYLANKSTVHPHPMCAERLDKHRIKNYWSYMVIRPHKELNTNGIDFVLTYFDNPGVSIPATITNWVAMRAMPDFCERLRAAAKEYKKYCKTKGVQCVCQIITRNGTIFGSDDFSYLLEPYEDLITDNTISEAQHNIKYQLWCDKDPPKPKNSSDGDNNDNSANELKKLQDSSLQSGTKSYLKYLFPKYFFS